MRASLQAGFTIIEVMLFLAISGALTVAIMVGAGASIGAQRYKDAVATFQSDIQQQYEDVMSVKNSRDTTSLSSIGACVGLRGQTNCVLMGKLMTISSSGQITQSSVWGSEPTTAILPTNELDFLRAYNPAVIPDSVQSSQMEWGTGLATPGVLNTTANSGEQGWTPLNLGIMVLRSPRSGVVYSFTRNTVASTNLSAMIATAGQARRTVCVTTTGWVVGEKIGVSIAANAASPSSVEVLSNSLLSGQGLEC